MKTQQTRVTVTRTVKTWTDTSSAPTKTTEKKFYSSYREKEKDAKVKECTLFINGLKVGASVLVPAKWGMELVIDEIMTALGNPYDKYGDDPEVDIFERFIPDFYDAVVLPKYGLSVA